MANSKFMLMVGPETFHRLEAKAKRGGVTTQRLLRAVVIPEWLGSNPGLRPTHYLVTPSFNETRVRNPSQRYIGLSIGGHMNSYS